MQQPTVGKFGAMRRRVDAGPLGVVGLLIACLVAPGSVSAQWPQFGGPNRDFTQIEGGIRTTFSDDGPKILWERDLGPGQSPFVIIGRNAYTLYRDGDEEIVVCIHTEHGGLLWETRYDAPIPEGHPSAETLGPRAAPVLRGVRVFTVGSLGHVNCFNQTTGEHLWSHDPAGEFGLKPPQDGYGASPLSYLDRILVVLGTENDRDENLLLTYHSRSGAFLWRKLNGKPTDASPVVADVKPKKHLLLAANDKLIGVEPLNGWILWEVNWKNPGQPVWRARDEAIIVPSLSDDGTGVVTLKKEERTPPERRWASGEARYRQVVPFGNYAIGAGTGADAEVCAHQLYTGEKIWCEGPFDAPYLLRAGDRLIILDQKGTLAIASYGPDGLKILTTTRLETHGAWAAPAIYNRQLLLRDHKRALAVDLR